MSQRTANPSVAHEHELKRQFGMKFLIARRDIFNGGDDRLQLPLRFFELRMRLYDLLKSSQLLLRLPRTVKRADQFVRLRNPFGANLDRLSFFRGN